MPNDDHRPLAVLDTNYLRHVIFGEPQAERWVDSLKLQDVYRFTLLDMALNEFWVQLARDPLKTWPAWINNRHLLLSGLDPSPLLFGCDVPLPASDLVERYVDVDEHRDPDEYRRAAWDLWGILRRANDPDVGALVTARRFGLRQQTVDELECEISRQRENFAKFLEWAAAKDGHRDPTDVAAENHAKIGYRPGAEIWLGIFANKANWLAKQLAADPTFDVRLLTTSKKHKNDGADLKMQATFELAPSAGAYFLTEDDGVLSAAEEIGCERILRMAEFFERHTAGTLGTRNSKHSS